MDHSELAQRALSRLRYLLKREKDRGKRWLILRIIEDVEDSRVTAEEAIWEAKNIGVRNPAFDGDMIGWLDDDFDWDDEDDKKKPKS